LELAKIGLYFTLNPSGEVRNPPEISMQKEAG
jgi:hypothetical protein